MVARGRRTGLNPGDVSGEVFQSELQLVVVEALRPAALEREAAASVAVETAKAFMAKRQGSLVVTLAAAS